MHTTQTCWNATPMLYGKSDIGKKKTFDVGGKNIYILFPERTLCLIHSSKRTVAVHV